MNTLLRFCIYAALLLLPMLCLLAPAALAAPRYTITDLGQLLLPPAPVPNPPGNTHVIAYDIKPATAAAALNDRGLVVGQSNGQAFLWQNGIMRGLGVLPSSGIGDFNTSRADAINSTGVVVGGSGGFGPISMSGLYACYPFRYVKSRLEKLTPSDNFESYEALGINTHGDIVGLHEYRAFFLHGITSTNLGTLSNVPAGNRSHADGINGRGQVVGRSTINGPPSKEGELPTHATLWQRHGNKWRGTDLKTLLGFVYSQAYAVNDRGQIVGEANASVPGHPDKVRTQAVLWSRERISALPGTGNSTARAINNQGQIVGASGGKAALWQDGRVYDVNALISPASGKALTEATGINNRGQIVANSKTRAFLLTPQPQ